MKQAFVLLITALLAYYLWQTSAATTRRRAKKFLRTHGPWIAVILIAIFGALLSSVHLNSIGIV